MNSSSAIWRLVLPFHEKRAGPAIAGCRDREFYAASLEGAAAHAIVRFRESPGAAAVISVVATFGATTRTEAAGIAARLGLGAE